MGCDCEPRRVCQLLKKIRFYIEVLFNIVFGFIFAWWAIYNLGDPGFVNDIYCQKNRLMKTVEDVVEDTMNNTCNSNVVLNFEPEDIKPHLEGMLYLQAIIGPCLVMTGVVALVGLYRTSARLLVPWLVANLLWVVSLLIAVAMLGVFGFQEYIYVLLVPLGISVLCLLDVGYYYYRKISRRGQYKLTDAVPMQDFGDHDETTAEEWANAS